VNGELLVVAPDGRHWMIENSYDGIKAALAGATLDLVVLPDRTHNLWVDDNGMVEALEFNACASLMAGYALYGRVVMSGPPDGNGDCTAPEPRIVSAFKHMAMTWERIVADARGKGQEIMTSANPATVPPPTFTAMSAEDFDKWLRGLL